MKLLILISLIGLSLGSYMNFNKNNWTVAPKIVSSDLPNSNAIWLLFDINSNPVILSANYSAPTPSTTVPGLYISTYSISQITIDNRSLDLNSGDTSQDYFINFPSHYTMSPAGSMIDLTVIQDSKKINQIYLQYNDLRVDQDIQSGFWSFIKGLFDFVETLVEDVVLIGVAIIQDILQITIDVSKVPSNFKDCALGVVDIADNLKDTHDNVKNNEPGSAVKNLLDTSLSLPSLFSSCLGQNLVVPDRVKDATQCGSDLTSMAGMIVDLAAAPEIYVSDVVKMGLMLNGIPSTISSCTGAFTPNPPDSSNSLKNGSGFLTKNTVNTNLYVLGQLRTSDYLGIVYLAGNSGLRVIGLHLDSVIPVFANLTDNLSPEYLQSCSTGSALDQNSIYCIWVEESKPMGTIWVIKGAIVDLTTGERSNVTNLTQHTNSSFTGIEAFVTSESYGAIYIYTGDDQLWAVSNKNFTYLLGGEIGDRIILELGSIDDTNLYIIWQSYNETTALFDVSYEVYDGANFTLLADRGTIMSYDTAGSNNNIWVMNNGQGIYCFVQSGSDFYLGLVVFAPIGLISSLILLVSVLMSLLLL